MKKLKIYVDFDGTMAYYDKWEGPEVVGEPIPCMIEKIKKALKDDHEVTVYSARLTASPEYGIYDPKIAKNTIDIFCLENFGQKLPVTNIKGPADEFWDDKCKRIILNTGLTMGEFLSTIIEAELKVSSDYKKSLERLLKVIKEIE
jgi:hypothetical protein